VGNLWSTVADKFGTSIDHYGDGSGMIDGLFTA